MLEWDTESLQRPTVSEISRNGFEATPAAEEWRASMLYETESWAQLDGPLKKSKKARLHLCTT